MDTITPLTIQYGDWIIIYSVSLFAQAVLVLVIFLIYFFDLRIALKSLPTL